VKILLEMRLKGRVLHVGSGGADLPEWCGECDVTSLDIDKSCNPDIVADIMDMGDIGEFDIVFSSHVVEHFYEHQLKKVFDEFKRVLKDGGTVIMFVPNIEDVHATDEVLYTSYFGVPITGMDMIYGMSSIIENAPYMAHHTGFTKDRLEKKLTEAGFNDVDVTSTMSAYNLMGVGKK